MTTESPLLVSPQGRQSLAAGEMGDWSRAQTIARLERREAMLHAASLAATRFLAGDWRAHIEAVLRAIGEAADVSRLYFFEAHHGETNDEVLVSQRFEWAAPGAAPQIDNAQMRDLNPETQGLGRWMRALREGEVVQGTASDCAELALPLLREQDILAIALVPVRADGQWQGFLGFDECRRERVWDAAEIEVLHLIADLLGSAIARARADVALRASESELRALFDSMRDVVFVIGRDGRYLKVVTNDESLLFRPATELIGRTVEEVIGGETAHAFLDVVERVLQTRALQRLEYNLEIGGRDVWFSASLTPLDENSILCVARDITHEREAREALRESETLFRLLTENSSDKIARTRPDGSFLYVSPSVQNLLGYDAQEMMAMHPLQLLHPDDYSIVAAWHERVMARPDTTEAAEVITYRLRHRIGHYVHFETMSRALRGASGEVREIHTVSRDVTRRRATEEALRQAEAKYRSIFENAIEGIFQTSPDGTYLDANPSLARIYGYDSPAELKEQLNDIGSQLYIDPRRRLDFVAEMGQSGAVSNFEAEIRRKDGEIIWISENARAVRDAQGTLLFYEGSVENITARKVAQQQLLHDALHDRLTGLANRALFMDRLGQSFGRLKRHPSTIFGVLFLDFDRFKNVNDSLGHMAGDQLLVALSGRLQGCLRPGDTVSRLGGDEFAVLLEDIDGVAGATLVAERIQAQMKKPFRLAGQEVFSSASIGIALANSEYERPEDLLRDADMAMYQAKALGKARFAVFDAGMHTRAVALLQLETDLRWAIERGEFRLFYQPIVSLESGRVTGFEALIRWQHPARGLVSPAEFIPIAEETGWIVPIGRWVLEEACRQLAQWRASGWALSMSVNLSGKQFTQPDLIPFIEETLRCYALPRGSLKLEITESALMDNAPDVTNRLLQLRDRGVHLGLDDFGTGYSSLSYLHRFPLDTLKIDRSFVARMTEGGENREIVRTIVSLGRNLGMDVVAEGVEENAQLCDLRALDCKHGQGYFFARPLTAEDALALLRTAPSW